MSWKYIEATSTDGHEITEEQAREHFGVHEKKCPALLLANGRWAVWCAAPRGDATKYDELAAMPTNKAAARIFSFVTAELVE